MLPLLELAGDNDNQEVGDAVNLLADRLRLTDEERRARSSQGQSPRFYHRVYVAREYLKRAHLLEDLGGGQFRITEPGRRSLESRPSRVDLKFLRQLDGSPDAVADEGQPSSPDKEPQDTTVTPEEARQDTFETLRNSLAGELLGQVMQASLEFFEDLVVDVLLSMGYGGSRMDAGKAIGGSGDEGIDGIIKEDRLGLDIIYIQAKRWAAKVGSPEIQKFVGALAGKKARKGVFITTSSYSPAAVRFADSIETRVILIDGKQLAELMIDHGVGVRTDATYELKRMDADYSPEGIYVLDLMRARRAI